MLLCNCVREYPFHVLEQGPGLTVTFVNDLPIPFYNIPDPAVDVKVFIYGRDIWYIDPHSGERFKELGSASVDFTLNPNDTNEISGVRPNEDIDFRIFRDIDYPGHVRKIFLQALTRVNDSTTILFSELDWHRTESLHLKK